MRIAVAGGTGCVGRHVVAAAEQAGHQVVTMSRRSGVDLRTGDGLAAALSGCDAVVDVTNTPSISRRASVSFFEAVTGNLLAAERAAGVGHHIALSIVGIDRVPLGYYAGKRRQEELIEAGDVPWTILRATQFYEMTEQLLQRAVGPVLVMPRMRCAPVAAAEVAEELVALAARGPAGRVRELGGPQQLEMRDLVRRLLRARGRRRWVVPVRIPGKVGRGLAEGGLLPMAGGVVGRQTFEEWLAQR